jgi:hypothetical protein
MDGGDGRSNMTKTIYGKVQRRAIELDKDPAWLKVSRWKLNYNHTHKN